MAEDPIEPNEPDIPNKPPDINLAQIVIAAIIGGVIGYLICHFTPDDSAADELPLETQQSVIGSSQG